MTTLLWLIGHYSDNPYFFSQSTYQSFTHVHSDLQIEILMLVKA